MQEGDALPSLLLSDVHTMDLVSLDGAHHVRATCVARIFESLSQASTVQVHAAKVLTRSTEYVV